MPLCTYTSIGIHYRIDFPSGKNLKFTLTPFLSGNAIRPLFSLRRRKDENRRDINGGVRHVHN